MEAFKRIRTLYWVGSSKKDLQALPVDVQDIFGFALHQAQEGGKHLQAKSLKGFTGAGVLEVVEDHNRSTYRAVYTVSFGSAIYVLQCFQKKSTSGIKTSSHDIALIRSRLKLAEAHSRGEKND